MREIRGPARSKRKVRAEEKKEGRCVWNVRVRDTRKNRVAWYPPVALVDHREGGEFLAWRFRGDALSTTSSPRLRRRERRRRAERQHAQELVEMAA